MPAVDPTRLRRQTARVVAATADPATLDRVVLEVLEIYRDRTRRPASAAVRAPAPSVRVLGVPPPVLRSLARGLREELSGDKERALTSATVLWGTGVEEAMSLAAACLSGHGGPETAAWVTVHAQRSQSRRVIEELAVAGLAGLHAEGKEALLEHAGSWLRSGDDRLQALALYALGHLAEARAFDDLPAAYRLLEVARLDARGFSRAALERVAGVLARRSPMETARFLADRLARGQPGAERLVRRVLADFPASSRAVLERALSGLARAGIIRPSE